MCSDGIDLIMDGDVWGWLYLGISEVVEGCLIIVLVSEYWFWVGILGFLGVIDCVG